jgi:CubicO group peptidase (beta-lactamase class C family)
VSVGSLVSNASDLARWVRLQLAGGAFGGRRLVSERAMVETHTPHSLIPPAGPIAHLAALEPSTHFWAYGLGWRMNDYRGAAYLVAFPGRREAARFLLSHAAPAATRV